MSYNLQQINVVQRKFIQSTQGKEHYIACVLRLSAYILSTTTPARTVSEIGFLDPNRSLCMVESIFPKLAGNSI